MGIDDDGPDEVVNLGSPLASKEEEEEEIKGELIPSPILRIISKLDSPSPYSTDTGLLKSRIFMI